MNTSRLLAAISLGACLLLTSTAFAQEASPAEQAVRHVGKSGMVCGKVERTRHAQNTEGEPTFLYMGGAELKPYDVWLAAYRTKKPAPSWPFGMWQYTSKARVPGVTTNVDMSLAYKDYAGIIRKKGLTRLREGK